MSGSLITKIIAAICVLVVVIVSFFVISFYVKKENKKDDFVLPSTTVNETTTENDSVNKFSSLESVSKKNEETESIVTEESTTDTLSEESTVLMQNNEGLKLTGISVVNTPKKSSYYIGDSFSQSGLVVRAKYSDGSTKNVSSFVKILTPNMIHEGRQTVTVQYSENGVSKETGFSVNVIKPTISISSSKVKLKVGETATLSAKTKPSGCSVSWSTSSDKVAVVSSSGKVTAIGVGITSVSAEFEYAGNVYREICVVEVIEENVVSNIKVDFEDGTYETSSDGVVTLYDLECEISSNYVIDYVCVGVIGPVYVNGKLEELDQYEEYDNIAKFDTKKITLEEIENLYKDEGVYEFDFVDGEEYMIYIYAQDALGATDYDGFELVF